MKTHLQELLRASLNAVLAEAGATLAPTIVLDATKDEKFGDFATNLALQIAKPLGKPPRACAELLVKHLPASPQVVKVEIAGPGFINFFLNKSAFQNVVADILAQDQGYGIDRSGARGKVMVEFVSANPTGPLHVGHGRQAALGDALCNLYGTQGWQVYREFYYNDGGVQIETLAASTQARARGLKPGDAGWPEAAYNGDYIADIAADFLAGKTARSDDREFTGSGNADDLDGIRQFAVAYLRHEQDLDLQAFGVRFDNYYLESSLYSSGRVDAAVQKLVAAGKTFEQDGALWLKTTDYGDDKDRVMRKSEGGYTYFVPDVAYHIDKFERGYTRAVNIQGTDHHGTIARVRAGLQAAGVGIPAGYPDYILHTMVRVMRGGEEVKISKRAGSYVTLRDLIEWTSRDAVRFFLLSRSPDTEYVFDVDLALAQNNDNPVYYVQYAHARIGSVFTQLKDKGGRYDRAAGLAALARLDNEHEKRLLTALNRYPEVLRVAATQSAPHILVHYLKDELAEALHSYYNAHKFLGEDAALQSARLALIEATQVVLKSGLSLLGVSAPEKM